MADHQVSELGDSQWQLKANKKGKFEKEKPDHSVPGVESIQQKHDGSAGPD